MTRNWRYNNGSNRSNQTPHNNGQYNNGPNNNTPLNKGPQNGNQYPRGPRNTNFYNRVSRNDHNSYNSRNINPNNNYNRRNNFNNGNSNSVNSGNTNGNAQRPILHSSSPDERQPEGRFTINNTVVTHPAPRTPALDTSGPRKQASGKPEDRSRLEKNICDAQQDLLFA
ncbi:hypothetical protein LZ31DRAFT_560000 [Colletotrichum somersetense]|nr:hypothetical protein LZ31DRAFT_560000 [Colletotrichum somersetense]